MKKHAFTLAEVICVIAILGIIAAITIPITAKRTTEKQNRVKIVKAISTYEKALAEYYITSYDGYDSEYKKASVLDPNGVTNELQGEDLSNARKQLIAERKARLADVKSRYAQIFSNQFKKRQVESDSIFQAPDGLWWDIGTDGKFLSIIVAFKREDLTAEMANSRENKAFYLTAEQKDFTKTPIVNSTEGLDMSNLRILDFAKFSSAKSLSILQRYKLFCFINQKVYNPIADKICADSKCCDNTKGSCMQFENTIFNEDDDSFWSVYDEIREYEDGNLTTYTSYDNEHNVVAKVDYKNKTASLDCPKNKNNKAERTKRCVSFSDYSATKTCSAVTVTYWDICVYDGSTGDVLKTENWGDSFLGCRTKVIPCDQ